MNRALHIATFITSGGVVCPIANTAASPSTRMGTGSRPIVHEVSAMTVFVYVNHQQAGWNPEHIKVFATADAAAKWFEENDPEGVAFEYEVLE